MRVFISSTFLDLQEHRRVLTDAIERMGNSTSKMETFGARSADATTASLDEVTQCDLFVGVYAHRYGFIPDGSDVSVTEQEFRRAVQLGKPLFCYIVDDEHPWPPKYVEVGEPRRKLDALKSDIGRNLVRDRFTTPEDLAYRATAALARHLSAKASDEARSPESSALFRHCSNLAEALDVTIRELERITRTDYNQVLMAQPDSYALHLVVVADAIASQKQSYRIATLAGLLGQAFLRRETIVVDDVHARPGYFQAVPETVSELVVPIAPHGAPMGVLNSEAEERSHYGPEIVGACEDLAAGLGETILRLGVEVVPGVELPWVRRDPAR